MQTLVCEKSSCNVERDTSVLHLDTFLHIFRFSATGLVVDGVGGVVLTVIPGCGVHRSCNVTRACHVTVQSLTACKGEMRARLMRKRKPGAWCFRGEVGGVVREEGDESEGGD